MTRFLDEENTKILIERWLIDDPSLIINERVFVLEKMVRELLKKVKELEAHHMLYK
jgi:hypothetical protein